MSPGSQGDSWEEVMNAVNKYDKELRLDIDSTLIFVRERVELRDERSYGRVFGKPFVRLYDKRSHCCRDRPAYKMSQYIGTVVVCPACVVFELEVSTSWDCGCLRRKFLPFTVTADAVRINIFWILSLIITLSRH